MRDSLSLVYYLVGISKLAIIRLRDRHLLGLIAALVLILLKLRSPLFLHA
jgi:hypothetical protein